MKYPTVKTTARKLSNKINIDSLPDILFDKEDYDNAIMDIAKLCKENLKELTKEEKELYNLNPELITKHVTKEVGLMI